MRRFLLPLVSLVASFAAAGLPLNLASCSGSPASPSADRGGGGSGSGDGGASGGGDGGLGVLPFAPDNPYVYVAKVKNILVGLPPTNAEVQSVIANPSQLGTLVDQWMQLPQYQTKMLRFFELAFQQTQIATVDFGNQFDLGQFQPVDLPIMLQSAEQSFAQTMLSLMVNCQPVTQAACQPFINAMNTTTYALTPALKVFYAVADVWNTDDELDGFTDSFQKANPNLNIYVSGKTQYELSDTLNPQSPNYMHWYIPGLTCSTDPMGTPARANALYGVLMGSIAGNQFPGCTGGGSGVLTGTDFTDWQLTTISQPTSGQATTAFYDLNTLRTTNTMVLNRPYVSFFTTPAFFANWQTNNSNTMRVTMNQTFIVSTGAQVDGTDPTLPPIAAGQTIPPGEDSVHAAQGTACYGCHQLLDPSRSILAQTFSWNYGFGPGIQDDPTFASQPGEFAFEGVTNTNIHTIYDLANTLSTHPLVPKGWAEKLCYYVDSEACVESDPAFQSIVSLFTSSNYSWNQLVKAVVTSPITTHTVATTTATTNGEVVAVSRRDHLCAAWNARLGFQDYCGLDVTIKPVASTSALNIVSGLPSDGYGRGAIAPVMPNQPSMFFRGATENLCESIASFVIDNNKPPSGVTTWSSSSQASVTAAIQDFVSLLIGLTSSDPRTAPVVQILQNHYNSTVAVQGMTPTDALQSTFTAACMAPPSISIGL